MAGSIFARALAIGAVAATFTGGLTQQAGEANAKTPGQTYCFYKKCHRVLTLAETQARLGRTTTLQASHYDSCKRDRYNPCGLTSSGEEFHADRTDNAASPTLPNGTILLVRYPVTGKSAVIRVNNAGPYWGNRTLDLSRGAAKALGFDKRGVAAVEVKIIHAPSRGEATYARKRTYPKVPGYLGTFASIDAAGVRYAEMKGSKAATVVAAAAVKPSVASPAPMQAPTEAPKQSVASLYPQAREGGAVAPAPSITGGQPNQLGNGLERVWVAQGLSFKPERRWAVGAHQKVAREIAPPRSARSSRRVRTASAG